MFNTRPTSPKYTYTWDTDILLRYLKELSGNEALTFKLLAHKTATLLTLLTGQRVSTIPLFDTEHMDLQDHQVIFHMSELLKHSRPGKTADPFVFNSFQAESRLCPVNCIKAYLEKRNALAQDTDTRLFITYGKPHHPASKNTISRWCKQALAAAGINTKVFQSHSIRVASTSKAKSIGVSIDTILKYARWSKQNTFYKFYHRDIRATDFINTKDMMDTQLLECSVHTTDT